MYLTKVSDSRHVQLSIYTVFQEESESAVRIDQFLHPEEEIKKNQPTRVSISYRKISYCMSPPYGFYVFYVFLCFLCLLSSLLVANDEILNKSIAPIPSSLNFHDKFSLPLNACSIDNDFT